MMSCVRHFQNQSNKYILNRWNKQKKKKPRNNIRHFMTSRTFWWDKWERTQTEVSINQLGIPQRRYLFRFFLKIVKMRTIGKPKDPPTQSEWTKKRYRSTMARRMKRATPEPFLYVTAIINFHFLGYKPSKFSMDNTFQGKPTQRRQIRWTNL